MEPRLYSNKIESVGLRKCPYYHYLTKKVLSQWQMFIRVCPASWRESSWHIYGMNKLRQCHFMYTTTSLWSLILLLNSLMETGGNETANYVRAHLQLIVECDGFACSSSARKLAVQEYPKWLASSTGPSCGTCSTCPPSASSSFPVRAQSVLDCQSVQKDRWFTLGRRTAYTIISLITTNC